jgi:hypothetical protein
MPRTAPSTGRKSSASGRRLARDCAKSRAVHGLSGEDRAMSIELEINEREGKLLAAAIERRLVNLDGCYRSEGRRELAREALRAAQLQLESKSLSLEGEAAYQLRKALYWAARSYTGWAMSEQSMWDYAEHISLLNRLNGSETFCFSLSPRERRELRRLCRHALARYRRHLTDPSVSEQIPPASIEAQLKAFDQMQEGEILLLDPAAVDPVRHLLVCDYDEPLTVTPHSVDDPVRRDRCRIQVTLREQRKAVRSDILKRIDKESEGRFSTCG